MIIPFEWAMVFFGVAIGVVSFLLFKHDQRKLEKTLREKRAAQQIPENVIADAAHLQSALDEIAANLQISTALSDVGSDKRIEHYDPKSMAEMLRKYSEKMKLPEVDELLLIAPHPGEYRPRGTFVAVPKFHAKRRVKTFSGFAGGGEGTPTRSHKAAHT